MDTLKSGPRQPTPWENVFAGAFAGCVTRFCIAPLDVLKIRFQIQNLTGQAQQYHSIAHAVKSIVRDEGVRAFWKGNLPAELMVIPFGAVSFVSYNAMKQWILSNPSTSGASSATISLASGSFSGMCATVATYPLDLLRTRLAAQREPKIYPTMSSAVVYIFRHEGVRGLYAGMWPTLVGIVPYMALQFASYEALKTASLQLNRSVDPTSNSLSPTQHGACGFLAGMSSKFLTMPLDVVKKRFQVDAFPFQQTCQDPTHHHGTSSNSSSTSSSKNSSLLNSKGAPSLSAAMGGLGGHSSSGSGGNGGGGGGKLGGIMGIGGVAVGAGGVVPEPHVQCVTPIAMRARYTGLIDCMRRIYTNEGVAGLFRGTVPSLIKAGPNSAITFVMYESCIRFMLRMRPTLD